MTKRQRLLNVKAKLRMRYRRKAHYIKVSKGIEEFNRYRANYLEHIATINEKLKLDNNNMEYDEWWKTIPRGVKEYKKKWAMEKSKIY